MKYSTILIALFLFVSFILFSFPEQNKNTIVAVNIAESHRNIVSVLPPVGEPAPIPNNSFSSTNGAPEVVLKYKNTTYQGHLRSAIFSSGDVNDDVLSLGENSSNITSIIPEQIINISQNDQVQIFIVENPQPELQPNSLSATAYYINGTAAKILSLIENDKMDKFVVNPDKGEYILLAVATWLPNPDNYLTTSGYVTYVFRVNVS